MVREKSSLLALFNDQASQLVQLHPKVQEEVGWRVTHLNSKWDSILSILGPSECGHCEQDSCLGIFCVLVYQYRRVSAATLSFQTKTSFTLARK